MTPDQTSAQQEQPSPPAARDYSHAWRALRHRNFRLFFGGQSISLIGTWMTRIATSWLVYRLTKSALLLGTVGFAGQIPTFLLAPLAGVIVDRIDRRKVLVWTQTLAMVQSLALAWLTLSHRITIAEVLALSAMQGVINAFDMPGRQSFMVKMVEDRADLSNAIAINSSMVNTARLIGPSLAGLLIAATSEGWCFLVDGVSYIAVIASLLMMRVPADDLQRATTSMIAQLQEGWTYVAGSVPIRSILLLFALLSLMGWPFMVLMPIFAGQVLHGGPHTLGFLMGAVGVGSLISALSLVMRRSVRGLTKMIPDRRRSLRHRPDLLRTLPCPVALDADDARDRFRHDAGSDREQHHHPNACRRKHARTRDELLHHGLRRHGSLRQPAGRRPGPCHRRATHGHRQRRCLHPRLPLVLVATARHSQGDAANLRTSRHCAAAKSRRGSRRKLRPPAL